MSKLTIPQNYHAPLSVYELQRAIEFIKSNFQVNLGNALNLRRVSAPLFVDENSGLNDNNMKLLLGPSRSTFPMSASTRRSSIHLPSGSGWRSSATSSTSARACSPI